jgi:copper(I)-binding protein
MMSASAFSTTLSVAAIAASLTGGLQGCSSERARPETTDLTVSHVFITEPAMGERAAMYLSIVNGGAQDDELTSVSTPAAGSAELHRTVERAGTVSMEPVSSLAVPAGGELLLSPGEYHIMLLELREEFAVGDAVEATLHFSHAGEVVVQAKVLKYADIEKAIDPHEHSLGRK